MSAARNIGVSALKVLRDLDTGVDAHSAWLKQLHRALICGTQPDTNNLSPDAHRLCVFGRWFYGEGRESLEQWGELRDGIESTHRAMHQIACSLVAAWQSGTPLAPAEYDRFMDSALIFKSELRALQFRIMTDICLLDHLTGAWNRNAMFQKLGDEYERAARLKQPCCLSILDLDHFKAVNDTYGHAAGDKVLYMVVECIRDSLRKYDAIFRYGGEEFLLCLPNIEIDGAVAAMERIRENLATLLISVVGGDTVCVTASFGVAPLAVDRSVEESIMSADRALFCAKAGGRNRVHCWNAGGAPS